MTTTDYQVRLSVTRIDLTDPAKPGELLLDVEGLTVAVADQARSWAAGHGHEHVIAIIDQTFAAEPPMSGFSATINKPTSLLVLVTWPWSPQPRRH